jgi:hypothetical protein
MIILDTNVLSALMRAPDNPRVVEWLDRQPRLSIWTTSVTMMEARYGLAIMPAGRRRDSRRAEFERFVSDEIQGRILVFDSEAAERTALLMATRRRIGRPIELRDTMIAGIALAQNATLATRNIRDFVDLHVPVVDPWTCP